MTENRWILSADIGEKNLQLSLCQNEQMQMKDELFPLPEEETEKVIFLLPISEQLQSS